MLCSTLLGGKDESNLMTQNYDIRGIRFLLILNNDDFREKSCWFYLSKPETILQNAHLFPGKIEVLSYSEFIESTHKYYFHNEYNFEKKYIPKQNKIYVKMPKEKNYVLLEDFTKKLILSQLNELNVIFLHLNAECVKIKALGENPLIEKTLIGIHPGLDEYIMSMGAENHESVEIRYPMPKKLFLFNIKRYFYYEKWSSIIKNRLKDGKYYNEYYFKYTKPAFLNEAFFKYLKEWNVDFVIEDTISEFELHFEIFYYTDEMIYYVNEK